MSAVEWVLWTGSGVPSCPEREEEGKPCLATSDSAFVIEDHPHCLLRVRSKRWEMDYWKVCPESGSELHGSSLGQAAQL